VRTARSALTFADLQLGEKHSGKVAYISGEKIGVDIGAPSLVTVFSAHISEDEDNLVEGQDVEVWLTAIRPDRLRGTMIEKHLVDYSCFSSMGPNTWLNATVHTVTVRSATVEVHLPEGGAGGFYAVLLAAEIEDGGVDSVKYVLVKGEQVMVRVLKVERYRLEVSMREPKDSAEFDAFRELPSDQWLIGTVARVRTTNAMVEVKAPGSSVSSLGVLPIYDIQEGYLSDVHAVLEEGQQVKVRVLKVGDDDMVHLSMLEKDDDEVEEGYLFDVRDVLEEGQQVKVRVLKVDDDDTMHLSMLEKGDDEVEVDSLHSDLPLTHSERVVPLPPKPRRRLRKFGR